jgi:hypothetical protein
VVMLFLSSSVIFTVPFTRGTSPPVVSG